ncbi:MAG: V-type ATP synthase subunit I [Bacillota bacterium]|nr:V-type ATP synthase subunit I [Bacillota bacterium]
MAIVKMNEFTLFAFQSQKKALLSEVEKFGKVQFVSLESEGENYSFLKKDSEDKDLSYLQGEIAKLKYSLEYINKFIPKEKGIKALMKEKKSLGFDEISNSAEQTEYNLIYNQLKKNDESIVSLSNEITKCENEIETLSSWIRLDASLNELNNFKDTIAFLGTIPKNYYDLFIEEFNKFNEAYVEKIGESKEGFNVMLLYHKLIQPEAEELIKKYGINKVNFTYQDTPANVIKNLKEKIQDNKKKITDLDDSAKEYIKDLNQLQAAYEYYDLEIMKKESCNNFVKTDEVIALRGWIPEKEKDNFLSLLNRVLGDKYNVEFRIPESFENVPILLKNNFLAEPYEMITATYSLPSYGEVDPTPILAPFFFLFFGMMFSDAGYGLVVLIASTLALKLMPLEESKKKFMKFCQSVGVSTIIWGVLYGSYFGDAPTLFISGGIKPLWVDASANPMMVLVVALFMGIVHLYTGLGVKAYELIRDKKYFSALFDVGFWYIILTGCILMLVNSSVNIPVLSSIGKYMALIGAIGLVLTQGRSNKGIFGKLAGGLYGLYGITGYIGDILSYSRLLALGLATGLIGSSFNLIIKLLPKGVIAIVLGIVIFVGGHIFNLLINALGAYVHTSRLQYLEFFGKFYSGGGKAFKPLRPSNKYINVIKD